MLLKIWDIKIAKCFLMLILISVFLFIDKTFAYVIGLDETGIVGLNDNLDILNNDFLILDLDFDGRYEYYYFGTDGFLKKNTSVGSYRVNDKGQRLEDGNMTIMNVGPERDDTKQIDNLDYYYIRTTKLGFNETWEIQDRLKTIVSIGLPEVAGIDVNKVNKINDILKNRGLELLKLYAKQEVYKIDNKKFLIDIEKYNRAGLHPLNFIVFDDNEFYFNFTIYTTLKNGNETIKKLGLYINLNKNTCKIQNQEYNELNNLNYENEDIIKEVEISKAEGYNSRYIDIINDLKEEYLDSLIEYIDNAENVVSEYDNEFSDDKKAEIRAVERYIKNIDSIYNTYVSKAKKLQKSGEIDEETYKKLELNFKDILDTYRNMLERNLNINLNALKEELADK